MLAPKPKSKAVEKGRLTEFMQEKMLANFKRFSSFRDTTDRNWVSIKKLRWIKIRVKISKQEQHLLFQFISLINISDLTISLLSFASEKKLNCDMDMFIDWIKQKTYCIPSSSCKRKELCCRNHRWKMFCPRGWRADTFLSRQCCSRCCNWPTPLPMSTCNLVKKCVLYWNQQA